MWGPLPMQTLITSVAWASGGGSEAAEAGSGGISGPLFLIGLVGISYLVAHFVIDRLQRRFLFSSGMEFLLVGVLLGPAVLSDLHAFDNLAGLAPIFALAAGWVGLLYGMEMDIRTIFASRADAFRLALLEALFTGGLVGASAWWFLTSGLTWVEPGWVVDSREATIAAMLLGCTAAAGSSSAVDLISRSYGTEGGPLTELVRCISRMGDLVAILAFGLMFCLFHEGTSLFERPTTQFEWVGITVGLGAGLGLLFFWFLADNETENSRFLASIGIITFASGAAFYLNLSLLTVNLLLGVVLVNFGEKGRAVGETVASTSRPVTLVLLIFAGAFWTPTPLVPSILTAALYMGVRAVGKMLGGWLATSTAKSVRRDVFRGLLAQGDVAVAMALSFKLVYTGQAADLAYTAVLCSVTIHEIIAPRLVKGLLIDGGDIRREAAVQG